MDATSIPLTAWEQAAVVVLFLIGFITLIGYLLRWFSSQQKDWQAFMKTMNDEWRNWLDDANCRESESMAKVTAALERLAEKLDAHDDKVEERFNRAVTTITKRGGAAK